MGTSYIYSYRLTYFGGTAPCYDGNYLSLAICKRDMRRVIGRGFLKKERDDEYWFIGLVGNELEQGNNDFKKNNVIYIAKVTGVKTFAEYFFDTEDKRKDKIYFSTDNETEYVCEGKYFKHKSDNTIHMEKKLQDRDWDIVHTRGEEKYVLISDKYCFLCEGESNEIKRAIDNCYGCKLATGVGHTWFCCNSKSDLVTKLKEVVDNSINYGVSNLPESLYSNKCKNGCGKDKAI